MQFTDQINDYIDGLKAALDRLNRDEISQLAGLLLDAYEKNANIFICGNGGSASTASHFACDINKGACYGLDKRFKVMPLTDNAATIMAYSNDVHYDEIFVEQLKNFIQKDDIVIGISGSGNSRNVLKAIEYANEKGNITCGITGYDGGKLKEVAKYSVNANRNDMQISEDIHMILTHLMMRITRKALMGGEEHC